MAVTGHPVEDVTLPVKHRRLQCTVCGGAWHQRMLIKGADLSTVANEAVLLHVVRFRALAAILSR